MATRIHLWQKCRLVFGQFALDRAKFLVFQASEQNKQTATDYLDSLVVFGTTVDMFKNNEFVRLLFCLALFQLISRFRLISLFLIRFLHFFCHRFLRFIVILDAIFHEIALITRSVYQPMPIAHQTHQTVHLIPTELPTSFKCQLSHYSSRRNSANLQCSLSK